MYIGFFGTLLCFGKENIDTCNCTINNRNSLSNIVLKRAIGAEEDLAHSSIRFGIGRFTTEAEVDYTAEKCIFHVTRLREMR